MSAPFRSSLVKAVTISTPLSERTPLRPRCQLHFEDPDPKRLESWFGSSSRSSLGVFNDPGANISGENDPLVGTLRKAHGCHFPGGAEHYRGSGAGARARSAQSERRGWEDDL
jgi:hypothetical protein